MSLPDKSTPELILSFLHDFTEGKAKPPAEHFGSKFPDAIQNDLETLYRSQKSGAQETKWGQRGAALLSELREAGFDLKVETWEDIHVSGHVPRKYIYSKTEFHRLEEEPPALKTSDGKTLLIGEGQVLVYAPTRSFKSFIALRWANQLAMSGKQVLFCVGERFKSFAKRSKAHDSYYEDAPPDGLHFADVLALHLDDGLIGWLNTDNKFDVVFVDTFRSAINPEDENSNSEIGRFLRALREVAKLVVIIHHTNRGGEDFAGAGAFSTNTDSEISVKAVEGVKLLRSIEIGQNDDESEFDLHYRLVMHDGSLVAKEADANAVAGAKARAASQSKQDKDAESDALWKALIEDVGDADGWASRKEIHAVSDLSGPARGSYS